MSYRCLLFTATVLVFSQAVPYAAAQTLTLSSATTAGTASLNLTLAASRGSMAAIEWTFQFPQAAISSISASAGAALTAAGKSISCTSGSGSYRCIAYGINNKPIADGVIAVVSVVATQTAAIMVTPIASSSTGSTIPISGAGGTVTVPAATLSLSSFSCTPTAVVGSTSSNCTVTLSAAAPQSTSIALSSSNTAVVVPASVTVPANSTSGEFAAVSSGGSSGAAALTATLNGSSKTVALALAGGAYSLRVNAGGGAYTDPKGLAWNADKDFTGGSTWSVTNAIANTTTPTLYQSCRWGAFSYTLPAPAGTYNVTLKFAELSRFYVGARQFNVSINGTQVLKNFDIFAQAGGAYQAIDEVFPVTVTNGQIVIQFSYGAADAPLVNAIDVEAAEAGTTPPVSLTSTRMDAGGAAYKDSQGFTWLADADYTGGNVWSVTNPITNTATPTLYQSCRWGAFTYKFAVPNGSYNVVLKFAELSRYAAGARQFDVSINGRQILTNFDIFAQAGGTFIAIDKSFPVTVTGGEVAIAFSNGAADAPMVNAIDIEPASTVTPVVSTARINSGGAAYTDPAGASWAADGEYSGGNIATVTNSIANTTTPALYQSCRWGSFSYTFTVPNGRYNVILKFAEISRFAAGARQFNVAINGATVLSNFDIYAHAGGAFIALDRAFPITVTAGRLVVQFSDGAADAPMVNAIEIAPLP